MAADRRGSAATATAAEGKRQDSDGSGRQQQAAAAAAPAAAYVASSSSSSPSSSAASSSPSPCRHMNRQNNLGNMRHCALTCYPWHATETRPAQLSSAGGPCNPTGEGQLLTSARQTAPSLLAALASPQLACSLGSATEARSKLVSQHPLTSSACRYALISARSSAFLSAKSHPYSASSLRRSCFSAAVQQRECKDG